MFQYDDFFKTPLAETEAYLTGFLDRTAKAANPSGELRTIGGLSQLWEALRYSLTNGGKRIRPILTLEVGQACGGNLQSLLPAACAIELVHTQSLIHDDLPCMDNDDLRRGKPTLHKAFNESTAVLTGDALISMAFGLMASEIPKTVAAQTTLDVMAEFANVTSVFGLVNGQCIDIFHEGKPYTEDVLHYIHRNKTGALFTFSAWAGAKLSTQDETVITLYKTFGDTLGLAFQIVDDLLDIHSTAEALGKTIGKDLAQEKATFPAFYGEAKARTMAETEIEKAVAVLETLSQDYRHPVERLKSLSNFIHERLH